MFLINNVVSCSGSSISSSGTFLLIESELVSSINTKKKIQPLFFNNHILLQTLPLIF